MAYPKEILEGTMPTGTKGTITIGGTVYIIESEQLTPSWTTAESRDSTGRANRKRHVRQAYELELTLQLATSATPYPTPGATFTYAVKNEDTAPTFYVFEVPENRNNENTFIESVTITCLERIAATLSVVTT